MSQYPRWPTTIKPFLSKYLLEDASSPPDCAAHSYWSDLKGRCVPIFDHPSLQNGSAASADILGKEADKLSQEASKQEPTDTESSRRATLFHDHAAQYHGQAAKAYKKARLPEKAQYHENLAKTHEGHSKRISDDAVSKMRNQAELMDWSAYLRQNKPLSHEDVKRKKLLAAMGQDKQHRVPLKPYQPAKGVPSMEESPEDHEKWGQQEAESDKPFFYRTVASHLSNHVSYGDDPKRNREAMHVIHQAAREQNGEDTELEDNLNRLAKEPKKIEHKEGDSFEDAGNDPDVINESAPTQLPIQTLAATKFYTRHGDEHVNSLLRKGGDNHEDAEKQVAHEAIPHLDKLTRAHRLKRSLLLHRGAVFDEPMLRQILEPGHTFTDHGFTSVSGSRDKADHFAWERWHKDPNKKSSRPVQFEIEAPKGSHGVNLAKHSSFINENEFLLPRGSSFTTISHKKNGLNHVVRVRLNTPEHTPEHPEPHWKKPSPAEMRKVANKTNLVQGVADIMHGRGAVKLAT